MSSEITAGSARVWVAYLAMGSAGVGGYYLIPAEGGGLEIRVALYCAVSASAVIAIWFGVLRNRPLARLPWLLLGAGQVMYAAADATFYVSHYLIGSSAYPSVADVLYLSHYPLLVAGLTLLIRRRAPGRDLPGLLDAAILGVAAALLSWLYLIGPQAGGGHSAAQVVSVAYPVMDLAVLAVALRLILGAGRRPASFFLLSGSLLAILAADTAYVLQQLHNVYHPGNVLDAVWLGGNLLLGAAALHPTMGRLSLPSHAHDRGTGPARIVALSAAALVAPGMLLIEYWQRAYRDIPATALACALLFGLTIARLAGLVADQRRLAITDALTGLHTRRFLEAQLALEVARARRAGTELAVIIFDVDHFKTINDQYGHPTGDRTLVEIASRLRTATRPGDVLARYGGEEFAVLAPGAGPDDLARLADRLRHGVTGAPVEVPHGGLVVVTVSGGAVSYPRHGTNPEDLVAAADRALYRAKAAGRNRVCVGETDPPAADPGEAATGDRPPMVEFLRRIADRVDASLSAYEHSVAISRWTAALALRLGLDDAVTWRLELAGRLHDIGKIVVPDAVLNKPGSLSEDEWRLLRQHPDHGSRLARLVPGFDGVAEVIRQHHERYDGTGYPDGRIGVEIQLEARIIAVCDAWAAMRCDRSYQAALDEERARDQLWAGRGTQFDPDLVEAFLALQEQGLVGDLQPIRQPAEASGQAPSARVFQKLSS